MAPRLVVVDAPESVGRAAAELVAGRLRADPELRLMLPDGTAADATAECRRHERIVESAPLGLVVLGLGPNGHVAFNEPGSAADSGPASSS